MGSATFTKTIQPPVTLPKALTGGLQETEAQDSTALGARPISPLVVGQAGENENTGNTRSKIVVVITVCATGLNALLASLVVITIPSIASDLHLGRELLLWYAIFQL